MMFYLLNWTTHYSCVVFWFVPMTLSILTPSPWADDIKSVRRIRTRRKITQNHDARREGAHPHWPLSQRGLDQIKPAYKPAVLVTKSTATQNLPFLPQRWPKPSPVLIALPAEGWPGSVGLCNANGFQYRY